jgi:hypothetical protein
MVRILKGGLSRESGLIHVRFVTVPIKRRLVALVAFLRMKATTKHALSLSLSVFPLANTVFRSECKIVVFLSSQDSVDFHYNLLKDLPLEIPEGDIAETYADDDEDEPGPADRHAGSKRSNPFVRMDKKSGKFVPVTAPKDTTRMAGLISVLAIGVEADSLQRRPSC